MGAETGQVAEARKFDEAQRRAVKAGALFQSVREKMQGKTRLDFPAIFESVLKRKLSDNELAVSGYKSDRDPEELMKELWYALVFEAYFAGHPHANIGVHLLRPPEPPNCYLWSAAK